MTELFNNLISYLHDVFVIKFDGWVILGFVAQGFFTMRFVVQWIASERARRERDAGGVLVFLDRRRCAAAGLCACIAAIPFSSRARRSVLSSICATFTSSSAPQRAAYRRDELGRRR